MRFFNCEISGVRRIVTEYGNELIDISKSIPDFPNTLEEAIFSGAASALLEKDISPSSDSIVDPEALIFHPPLCNPKKVIGVGANYEDHIIEANLEYPKYPVFFARWATSLVGHRQQIILPSCSDELDWEGELAVVIGEKCRHVPRERAHDVIFGYSIFNDVTARDYARKSHQWTMGKNFDATGAFGPSLVTANELEPGAKGLGIETRLNGETKQSAITDDMIFSVADLISIVSETATLEPGDVIITGTAGGIGLSQQPPTYLNPRDLIEVEIDGLGCLSNFVVSENLVH